LRARRLAAIIPAMGSTEGFERFRQLVLADPELQARLRAIREWPAFAAAAVEAAAEHGIDVTEEAVQAARVQARRSWLERWV
jgi:glutaredoxin-related protein